MSGRPLAMEADPRRRVDRLPRRRRSDHHQQSVHRSAEPHRDGLSPARLRYFELKVFDADGATGERHPDRRLLARRLRRVPGRAGADCEGRLAVHPGLPPSADHRADLLRRLPPRRAVRAENSRQLGRTSPDRGHARNPRRIRQRLHPLRLRDGKRLGLRLAGQGQHGRELLPPGRERAVDAGCGHPGMGDADAAGNVGGARAAQHARRRHAIVCRGNFQRRLPDAPRHRNRRQRQGQALRRRDGLGRNALRAVAAGGRRTGIVHDRLQPLHLSADLARAVPGGCSRRAVVGRCARGGRFQPAVAAALGVSLGDLLGPDAEDLPARVRS